MTGSDIYDRQWQDILDIFECSRGRLITYYLILSNTICWTLLPPNYYYAILHKYVNKRSELAPTDSPAKKGLVWSPGPTNAKTTKFTKWQGSQKSCQLQGTEAREHVSSDLDQHLPLLHFTFYIFYPPPPLSLQCPSAWAPPSQKLTTDGFQILCQLDTVTIALESMGGVDWYIIFWDL